MPDFARTLALVGPDPVTGQERVITPDNHLLTPAGKQISLPGMRPQALARLGATRAEVDETLGVATYMGGGPSLMYAASAIKAFDEFANTAKG